ncbi:hypothetical protein Celaphus_00006030, partial [Cervus elaphus hippelaphus]
LPLSSLSCDVFSAPEEGPENAFGVMAAVDIRDNLLGISWVDSSWIPILNSGSVLDYFSERSNPFYDRTCNNEVVKMQRLTLEHLNQMVGVEYILLHAQEPILFIIRKQQRQSPTQVIPLADYYIIAGVIYQAPDLGSVINSRVLTAVHGIQSAFDEAMSYCRYHPSKGYWWHFRDHEEQDKVKPKVKRKEEPSSIFQRQRVDALLLDLRQKFPPKFVQIEYALAVVAGGAPSVGIKAANGVVLATEKKQKSILYDERSVHKVEPITKHIGLVYSGMGPEHRARKLAQQNYLIYQEPIPTAQLVQRVTSMMQEYIQSGGVHPFGVSLLICGWNEGRPYLFQSDPSGAYFAWKATAMGKNYVNGKTFLEKRYNEDLELEDAIHTVILTLKESFEGQVTEDNIEVGICNEAGFRRLTTTEVKDYLAAIA